jgi:hypothetical protein
MLNFFYRLKSFLVFLPPTVAAIVVSTLRSTTTFEATGFVFFVAEVFNLFRGNSPKMSF